MTSLQPGDDVSFIVTYTNNYDASTDWYMENRILQTLEKASASKAVSGTGQAEHGAYTYELIHYDNNNVREVLFSNKEVGSYIEFEDKAIPDILETVANSLKNNGLDNITAFDVTDPSSIKINYAGRIVINIGVAEDIDYKIKTAFTILRKSLMKSSECLKALMAKELVARKSLQI